MKADDSIRETGKIDGRDEIIDGAEEAAEQLLGLMKAKMPVNVEAERGLLSAVLSSPKSIVDAQAEGVAPEDFYHRALGILWGVLCSMQDAKQPIDVDSVVDELERAGKLRAVGGRAALERLEVASHSPKMVARYARAVRETAQLREVIRLAKEATVGALRQEEPAAIVDKAQRRALEIGMRSTSSRMADRKAAYSRVVMSLEKRDPRWLPYPLKALNRLLIAARPGQLIAIAANTSVGKTGFVHAVLRHWSDRLEKKSALFSLEMGIDEIVEREIAVYAGINIHEVRARLFETGRHGLSGPQWSDIAAAQARIVDSLMLVDDTPGLTFSEIRSRARWFVSVEGVSAIAVDYGQLIEVDEDGRIVSKSEYEKLTWLSKNLKRLARELQVPTLILLQLNRDNTKRSGKGKRPMMSDLRGSGQFEQDLDVIMLLHSDSYHGVSDDEDDEDGEDADESEGARKDLDPIEIIVSKNRNGPTGSCMALYDRPRQRFVDLTTEEIPDYAP